MDTKSKRGSSLHPELSSLGGSKARTEAIWITHNAFADVLVLGLISPR